MIDPILTLAFSIYSNPGIYALLLGSGISRSAGIPTGWEIVLDLIKKLAKMLDENCEPDPAKWYIKKYEEEPDYSKLINDIAKSPSERSQLLRGYFEPSDEEKEQGLKVPTDAHKSIANLVANGSIKVIITTNFDRLLEKALEALNVTPTVISTPDAVEGALPLTHTDCTIIKLHGDYIDTRIKNTPSELESYDDRINQLLDRIFDEFGLIICGWSAEWDTALRSAIERCKSHRFTTYWTSRSKPKEIAQRLIKLRRSQEIRINDADSFFIEVGQKVIALQEFERQHPLSPKVAVASLKKYLPDERYRIQLHDLVMHETNRVQEEFSNEKFSLDTPFNEENYKTRLQLYESFIEILMHLFIAGCYWGEKKHENLWAMSLERVIFPSRAIGGLNIWKQLRNYPALILLYSGGISSILANRYNNLATLLTRPLYYGLNENLPLTLHLAPNKVIEIALAQKIFQMKRANTPTNDHLLQILKEPLKDYISDEEHYLNLFDRFEYFFTLVYFDLNKEYKERTWAPIGRFLWRNRDFPESHIANKIKEEAEKEKDNWPPIKAGLFGGSYERFHQIEREFNQIFREIPDF